MISRAIRSCGVSTNGTTGRVGSGIASKSCSIVHARISRGTPPRVRLIAAMVPSAADRAFTLKELVRLLEGSTTADERDPDALGNRVDEAARLRAAGGSPNPFDEDVVDPLGMPLDTYRAVAWELDGWSDRLVAALFGPVAAAVEGR